MSERGEGVVFAAHALQRLVVAGNVHRARKHEVLKEVGKAGVLGVFIARAHVVHHVEHGHGRAEIFVNNAAQAVVEGEFLEVNH